MQKEIPESPLASMHELLDAIRTIQEGTSVRTVLENVMRGEMVRCQKILRNNPTNAEAQQGLRDLHATLSDRDWNKPKNRILPK